MRGAVIVRGDVATQGQSARGLVFDVGCGLVLASRILRLSRLRPRLIPRTLLVAIVPVAIPLVAIVPVATH